MHDDGQLGLGLGLGLGLRLDRSDEMVKLHAEVVSRSS